MVMLDGASGKKVETSNAFSRLKSKGLFFKNMFTSSPYTLASLHSLFTGIYGSNNGVNGYYKINDLDDNCKTLTEYLKDEGYYCVGSPMRNELCPKSGFDIFEENNPFKKEKLFEHQKIVIDNTFKNKESKPFFLFLHCSIIHTSYIDNVFKVHDDFSETYFGSPEENSKKYDSYLNESLEYSNQIYDYVESKGENDQTIFIYLSDHGMGTGEKVGERAYGVYTYDYSLQMFAHFIYPPFFKPGTDCKYLSSNIDILPTILNLLDIEIDTNRKKLDGLSLTSFFDKHSQRTFFDRLFKNEERYIYGETGGLYGPWPSPDSPNVRCIRTDEWKLIHNLTPDTWELYNIVKDPNENINLYSSEVGVSTRMKKKLMEDFKFEK